MSLSLREYLTKTERTQRRAARELGISEGHMSDILSGRRKPSPKLAAKVQTWSGGKVFAVELIYPKSKRFPRRPRYLSGP